MKHLNEVTDRWILKNVGKSLLPTKKNQQKPFSKKIVQINRIRNGLKNRSYAKLEYEPIENPIKKPFSFIKSTGKNIYIAGQKFGRAGTDSILDVISSDDLAKIAKKNPKLAARLAITNGALVSSPALIPLLGPETSIAIKKLITDPTTKVVRKVIDK